MVYKTYLYFYNFFFNYPTPANLTNVWNFGILSFFFLIIQIISGLCLSMYYVPTEEFAFVYVEYIMRDTYFGWFFRYIHSNGASLFFFFVYMHFFRSLYYFSYVHPKIAVWNTGVLILVLMIITAFTGYVLPWGQMSFWACTVITNLATVIPITGSDVAYVVWGSYGVSTQTLNRFYTIHFILPFIIFLIMVAHFYYLHKVGSSNGTQTFVVNDKMKFHPYYTWKDAVVVTLTIIAFILVLIASPNFLGHSDNYIPANNMVTPEHIVPEWYFLAFYAILRSMSTKLGGVLMLAMSIGILFIFPFHMQMFYCPKLWHKAKCESTHLWSLKFFAIVTKRTNPLLMDYLFWFFVIDFVGLSYIGMQPIERPYFVIGQWLSYFFFFFFTSSMYIHSFNLWVINLKGAYLPDLLFIVRTFIWCAKYLYSSFLLYLIYINPFIYLQFISIKNFITLFIFKNILEKHVYYAIKEIFIKIAKQIDRWDYLYSKGELHE